MLQVTWWLLTDWSAVFQKYKGNSIVRLAKGLVDPLIAQSYFKAFSLGEHVNSENSSNNFYKIISLSLTRTCQLNVKIGSPGLVVMGDNSYLRGREFESWRCILDGLDIINIFFVLKLYRLFEKTKNKWKRGWGWSIFKKPIR